MLYRPEVTVSYRFARGDSISFTYDDLDKCLQALHSAQHVRAMCASRLIRKAARGDEAWSLRTMARLQAARGNHAEARAFAWQALCTAPTAGAAVDFLRTLGSGLRSTPVMKTTNRQTGA